MISIRISYKYLKRRILGFFFYIFRYFFTACHEPNIPTNTPIIISNSDARYTNGVGSINWASVDENNFPSKNLYNDE